MNFTKHHCQIGDSLYQIDSKHDIITIKKNGSVNDHIPNNFNREITKEEFIKMVTDHARKYL